MDITSRKRNEETIARRELEALKKAVGQYDFDGAVD